MRSIFLLCRIAVAFVLSTAGTAHGAAPAGCVGQFMNPITDICWACIMPITLAGAVVANLGSLEDIENPPDVMCTCVVNPTVGLSLGYWEPARHVEVVRKPFCLVSMGGIDLGAGLPAPEAARRTTASGVKEGFYQAHYYHDPVMYWLKVIADMPCMETGTFDLAFMTEVDPTWNDEQLALILQPQSILFASPPAVIACAADCVAATLGFGLNELFWCAGCQGGLYPLTGMVSTHMGGIRTAELVMQRLMAKMHGMLLAWGFHGKAGMCGPYYLPVMDKRAYKSQLVYPTPTIVNAGFAGTAGPAPSGPAATRCCQPFGRSTILWGAGKEYPVKGEDYAFMVFRKRNCCIGY